MKVLVPHIIRSFTKVKYLFWFVTALLPISLANDQNTQTNGVLRVSI